MCTDWHTGIAWHGCGAKNGIFFEFSLCLSRACLCKMIVLTPALMYKWLKNAVFRRVSSSQDWPRGSSPSPLRRLCLVLATACQPVRSSLYSTFPSLSFSSCLSRACLGKSFKLKTKIMSLSIMFKRMVSCVVVMAGLIMTLGADLAPPERRGYVVQNHHIISSTLIVGYIQRAIMITLSQLPLPPTHVWRERGQFEHGCRSSYSSSSVYIIYIHNQCASVRLCVRPPSVCAGSLLECSE
jgi:hypothetical protein